MKIFVCLDEMGGMTFNQRRQSSDRLIRADMLRIIGNKKLFVNSYTVKQFAEGERVIVDDDCLENAKQNDYVFIENMHIGRYISSVEQIIVYRWKRKYPADFYFDVDLTASDWQLSVSEKITGHSHECIGKEVYVRENKHEKE